MNGLQRAYRGLNDIDFPRLWRRVGVASAVAMVVSVGALLIGGLNLSIDFVGGAVWEVPSDTMSPDDALDVLGDFDRADGAKVQEVQDAQGTRFLRVQADISDAAEGADADVTEIEESQDIAAALAERAGIEVNDVNTNTVGPSWGREITNQAAKSLVVFLILISAYISWQLEWRMAIGAIVATIHDLVLTVGIYAVFRFAVTPATVIAFLTILGFSLYDTIVVCDRVRENAARYERGGNFTYAAIMRRSANQVLMRSINTTVLSILPVLSMLVIGSLVFGQSVIGDFSLALLIGLVSGTYSSLFVAAPMVVWLKEREPRFARIRQRAVERGTLEEAERIPVAVGAAGASGPGAPAGRGTEVAANVSAAKAAQYRRPHPPRPRKQGKKR